MIRNYFLFIIVIFPAALALSCGSESGNGKVYGSGSIEADEVRISSTMPGRIRKIHVKEGEHFKRDSLLVTLVSDEVDSAVDALHAGIDAARKNSNQAYASYRNAEREYKRAKDLHQAGAMARQDLDKARLGYDVARSRYDAARAQVRQLEASLRQAETRQNETNLRAPLDGIVLEQNFQEGEVVLPGSAILSVADLSRVNLRIYVPEPDLPRIKHGQKANVHVDGSDTVFTGKVVHIASKAEFTPRNVQTAEARARLVFAIKLSMDNPDGILKPGMPADAELLNGTGVESVNRSDAGE